MRWLVGLLLLQVAACGGAPPAASPAGADGDADLPAARSREAAPPAAEPLPEAPVEMRESGLGVVELEPGKGRAAQLGDRVAVHFVGRLSDGRPFDSTYDRGAPFELVLGDAGVLDGFNEGIVGMRVGGKRRLIVPPSLAYGDEGAPPDIPPNALLEFDIELVAVE